MSEKTTSTMRNYLLKDMKQSEKESILVSVIDDISSRLDVDLSLVRQSSGINHKNISLDKYAIKSTYGNIEIFSYTTKDDIYSIISHFIGGEISGDDEEPISDLYNKVKNICIKNSIYSICKIKLTNEDLSDRVKSGIINTMLTNLEETIGSAGMDNITFFIDNEDCCYDEVMDRLR